MKIEPWQQLLVAEVAAPSRISIPSTLSKSHDNAAAKTARPAPDPKSQNLPPGCRPLSEHLNSPANGSTNFAVGQRRRHEAMLSPFLPGRALADGLGVELVELVVEVLSGVGGVGSVRPCSSR